MAQTSHLWSRGLVWVFLTSAVLLLVSATEPNGRIRTQRAVAAAYSLSTVITNLPFNDSLLHPGSNYYNYLTSLVDDAWKQAFFSEPGTSDYLGTADITFTKGQLINVMTIIRFNSMYTHDLLKNIFNDYMTRTTSVTKFFRINSDKTNVTNIPISTTTTTTTSTTSSSSSRSPSTYISSSEPASTTPLSTNRKDLETNGTTSSATTNHTTPSQHHTTGWTSTLPNTIHSDPPEPATSSISKPTPVDQRGSNSMGTTPSDSTGTTPSNSTSTTPSNSRGTTPYPLVPYWLNWVPGWGIALLVLASLILLLLIILIILLLLRWCCMDEPEMEPEPRYDPYAHEPYLSHSPAKTPILKHMVDDVPRTPEKPRGNRTGMYVVNP